MNARMMVSEMVTQSLISEFRNAAELHTLGYAKSVSDNPVLDVINQFATDKRVNHFIEEDLPSAMSELGTSLSDVFKIDESITSIDQVINRLQELKKDLGVRRDIIIDDHVSADILQEGCFRLEPVIKHGNRKPDVELIRKMYPEQWEQLKENYVPTITDLKFVFRKGYDAVLIPGEEKVSGYELKLAMPEKAGEVGI